ncbi:MAG: ATP-binding protein [Acidovorax sp.]
MPAPLASTVEQELLDAYAQQGPRVPIAVLLSALLIVAMAWSTAPLGLSMGWLAAVAMVLIIRSAVHLWASRSHRVPTRRRMWAVTVVSLLGGIAHGSSILFWPYLSDLERAVQSTYVLALSSGAVAAVIGYMPVFVAYMLPLFLPLVYSWVVMLATAADGMHRGTAAVILLLFSIYGGLLIVLARDTFNHYRESFDTRWKLHEALERAESASRAKTRFLASASHDLRQPMHTLTLFGAALAVMSLPDRARHVVSQMNLALLALSEQLDALLDVSKLDAGVMPVNLQPLALHRLLEPLGLEYEAAARRKGLAFNLACEHDLVAMADRSLLERVFRNLIDNAVKYTVAGRVQVAAHAENGNIIVRVSDTGIGIPAVECEHVFEEFYQIGNPERDRSQGMGLGLSIVRRLVDLMQLTLELRSTPGAGTEVTLGLPRTSPLAPMAEPLKPVPADVAGLHLLVIDDEEQVRQGMQIVLEGLGCEVVTARDRATAHAAADRHRPDVVLADFRLRGQDTGIAVIKELRRRWPGLPALLVSGDTAPERLREADADGLHLLHKPVQPHALIQAIRDAADGVVGR